MRLTKEVTEDLVKEVAGEDTIKLVGILKEKDNISEFKLAEKLRLTVNTVRNMLYRLQAHNLVTSTRKKDKKKGWYVYYWTFNTPQARSLMRVVKQRKLRQLKERLRTEIQETFYVCPENCMRFKMDMAMEHDFKCPECGNVLQEEDNTNFVEKIKSTITELEQELTKPTIETRIKTEKRGRPRLTKRGRPKLARRGRPPKAKKGKPKLAQKIKLAKRERPKLKTKKIRKTTPRPKKRSVLKRVRRFLKRR